MVDSRDSLVRRWDELVTRVGLDSTAATAAIAEVLSAHEEPARRYHDLLHLTECFELVDAMADLSPSERSAVELSIWFHDLIYDPTATDNEQRSAAQAGAFLRDAGRPDVAPAVVEAIEMTAGHAPITRNPIIDAVHDADLGILGASAERYDEYAAAIRLEYGHVSDEDFREGRSRILRSFLAMPDIYVRPDMAAREIEARRNLEREVRALATAR